jgi:hypothetical protein
VKTDVTPYTPTLSTAAIDNQSSCFIVTRPGDHSHEVKGCFDIKRLEVTKR